MILALRIALFVLAAACGLISLMIPASFSQVRKNKMLLADIRDIVVAIKTFNLANGRLPTDDELSKIEDSVPRRYSLKYNFRFGAPPAQAGEHYPTEEKARGWMIWYWRGEWSEFYSSWDDHYSIETQTNVWAFCKPVLWAPPATLMFIGLAVYPWNRKKNSPADTVGIENDN
jgi:hypothetical protein